jgi:hypothetical protein
MVAFISVENILFLTPEQEKDKTHFLDKDVSDHHQYVISILCIV